MTRDFGDDVFAGAAKYYSKYRPKYPAELFDDITKTFSLDGRGRLLDLGCGTGELAIPLAKYFEEVLAVDPDPDMLAEGHAKAKKLKLGNITWQKGSSKELNGLKGPFKLVVMGRSFHWMDQETVLNELYDLAEKGGGMAVIGTEPVKQGSAASRKDKIIQEVLKRYLGPERLAGGKIYSHPPKRYEDLLPSSKFRSFKTHAYTINTTMNIDQTIGNLYSFSWANPNHFGSRLNDFETELRQQLKVINSGGKFKDKICFGLYTVSK